jgi:hypothetical protein
MRKSITFKNALLFFLTITVLWLVYETKNVSYNGTAYMKNKDSGFTIIKTDYSGFPVTIEETKSVNDRTELSLILINPLNVHFSDAELSVHVYTTVETVKLNLAPGTNIAKFKIPYIEADHPIKITLGLKRVYFK